MKHQIRVFQFLIIYALIASQISAATTLTKGPFLASPGKSEMTVRWESDTDAKYTVKFGVGESLNESKLADKIGEKEGNFLYEAKLTGLKVGTSYSYQISAWRFKSAIHAFKTDAGSEAPFTFIVTGDTRSKPEVFSKLNGLMQPANPQIILHTGDIVQAGGNYEQWGEYFFQVAADLIDHVPVISTLGDHEGNNDGGELVKYFLFPEIDAENFWFSYDYGNIHFVSLDYRHPDNPEQIDWFKNDMRNHESDWTVVYMHRPIYNVGGHRSAWGKKVWSSLMREYGVDLVFAGHSHLYERFYPIQPGDQPDAWPVTYITTGGGGASLYESIPHASLAHAESVYHFVTIKVDGNQLEFSATNIDGETIDSFSMTKDASGNYTPEYLKSVVSSDALDLNSIFAQPISEGLNRIPLIPKPAVMEIELTHDAPVKEDITYTIQLAEKAAENYKMEPITGVLAVGETQKLQAELYALGDLTVSGWGALSPELRLVVNFKTDHTEGQVIGGLIRYKHY